MAHFTKTIISRNQKAAIIAAYAEQLLLLFNYLQLYDRNLL